MAKRRFVAGIPCIALLFGLTLAGCDLLNGGGGDSNPFVGTWTGSGYTLTVTVSAWESGLTGETAMAKGAYAYSGNTLTLTVTHHWDDGAWKKLDEEFTLTYTVSGNTLTGVDNEGNPVTLTKGGGGNGNDAIDSALVGKWYSSQAAADSAGTDSLFEFTADGKATGGVFVGGEVKLTTSNGRISATTTVSGTTVDNGSAAYAVSGTQLTFSNPQGGALNIFSSLSAAGSYYKKAGGGGDSANPFVGAWTGSGYTLTVTASAWESGLTGETAMAKGAYAYSGNTLTLTVTHHWDDGAWKKLDEEFTLTYTVSGNTLTGVDNEGNPVTLTKGGGGNNAAKTLVITAIPADVFGYHTDAEDEGVAIFPQGTSSQDAFEQKGVVAVVSFSNSNVTASKSAPFTLTLPLHLPSSGKTSWTGSGTYDVYVGLSGDGGHYYKAGSVTISAATTTIPFTSFTELNLPK